MISRTEIKKFRNELLVLANRAEEVSSELASEQQRASPDGALIDPYRPAEIRSEAAGQVVTSQLRKIEAGVEREAMAAIERIDKGTFGKCERCGGPIPKGRLEAIPYVRTCMKCAG
jgi:RNA polymerase-binding transcription factor DksA